MPLTEIEILSTAPEQLQLWIAHYIFGAKWQRVHPDNETPTVLRMADGSSLAYLYYDNELSWVGPNYASEIGAVWLVIEYLKLTYSITIENCTDKVGEVICRVFVPFTNNRTWASADNAPMSICRAALLAKSRESS